ncbi:Indole-3-glycerol phosphate synthase [compost metagenome]
MIGINNRNLHTFETSLQTTETLAAMVPEDVTLISESGIRTREDIEYLSKVGANGVLIGETFMRQEEVDLAVLDLLGPVIRSGETGEYEGSKA